MRFGEKAVCGLVILAVGVLRAEAPEPSAADQLSFAALTMQMTGDRISAPILMNPNVADADKEKVKAISKTMMKACGDAVAEARKEPVTPETVIEVQKKFVAASQELTAFLNDREDLRWVQQREIGFAMFKANLLETPEEMLKHMKAGGIDEEHLGKAKGILEEFGKDMAKLKGRMVAVATQPYGAATIEASAAATEAQIAAIKKIEGLMTADQRLDYEWSIYRSMPQLDDEMFDVVLYSTEPVILHAPQDGTYILKNGKDLPGKDPATVPLKKGDKLGFRVKDKAIEAVAGEKVIEIAGDAMLRWQRVK